MPAAEERKLVSVLFAVVVVAFVLVLMIKEVPLRTTIQRADEVAPTAEVRP